MSKLILMRHGESLWNKHNLFTGWVDVPLSEKGVQEALKGGQLIKDLPIDIVITTVLVRAQMTAFLALLPHHSGKVPVVLHPGEGKMEEWSTIYNPEVQSHTIPVIRCWELNERMYGDLQGVDKSEMVRLYGAEQVQIWRRSYDVAPPNGESLEMTAARSIPYFEEKVVPLLQQGLNVFISAHGNSLRAIIMDLDQLSQEQVVKLEIATGMPIVYDYSDGQFKKEPLPGAQ